MSNKVKCYSVRLESLLSISDKCYKAHAFDGSQALIPKSQVYGKDYDVQKCDAYWLSAWILERKEIQYSTQKEAWFDAETGDQLPTYSILRHVPEPVEAQHYPPHEFLKKH